MIKSASWRRTLGSSCLAVGISFAIFGCSAAEQSTESTEPSEQLDVVSEALSAECTTAAYDKFVSVTPDCQGCNPGEGRYVVSSQLPSGNYASSAPCKPNYILQVGGSQKTFMFRAFWEDKIPTLADVPAGGSIVNVCKALKLTVAGNYRGVDLPTRVATGNWNGSKCVPPKVEFNFTHTVLTGQPGEFFSHARFLISAETAATKGKSFAVHLCRGANSCG